MGLKFIDTPCIYPVTLKLKERSKQKVKGVLL